MRTKIYGVGVNDADYVTEKREVVVENGKSICKLVWRCPYFARWTTMLRRCYSAEYHKRKPTYAECFVCEEWLTFSNFKRWMEQQDWEGKQLDKDLLKVGNKCYSPSTCKFISQSLNNFILSPTDNTAGSTFSTKRNKYVAVFKHPITGVFEFIGRFKTAEEANVEWRKRKQAAACELALLETDPDIQAALIKRYSVQ